MMKTPGTLVCCLVALATVGLAEPAVAATPEDKNIINLAGRQRMLTQKMSKELTLVALGIDPKGNLRNLRESRDEFQHVLDSLRNGDAALELSKTTDPEILEDLSKVYELWLLFDAALTKGLTSGEVPANLVSEIADLDLPLLKAMDRAVRSYETAAAGKTYSMLAVTVNLCARQRMLIQKMAKEVFLIAYGHRVEFNRKSLRETYILFEQGLDMLIEGSGEKKVFPAPTPAVRAQLRKVWRLWDDFLPLVKAVAEGAEADPELVGEVARTNLPLLTEMDRAVLMYVAL